MPVDFHCIAGGQELLRFLEEEIWPRVPRAVLGKRVSRRKREAILGLARPDLTLA